MKLLFYLGICCMCFVAEADAQSGFVSMQKQYPRVAAAFRHKEDSLKMHAKANGFVWPLKQVYFRAFKAEGKLEVWARDFVLDSFRLFKTYAICAMSGTLGPKRISGDFQVPEGFYSINEFNPQSTYHLSLGLNYPNSSDKVLSDKQQPGNDIYIHGACVTIGCLPLQNDPVEEVYVLAVLAKSAGQDFIPVHIFPVRFGKTERQLWLETTIKDKPGYSKLVSSMEKAYHLFEQKHRLPVVAVNKQGDYLIF